jgi:hypothetical protein
MNKKCNSAVGLFSNHQDAESAVKELQKSGFDMKKLSVVGKDYQTERLLATTTRVIALRPGANWACFGGQCGDFFSAQHFLLFRVWVRL